MAVVASGRPRALVALGNFFFFHRNWLLTLVMLGLFSLLRPVHPGGSELRDRWLDLLGIAIILLGQTLRAIVIGLAYIARGGKEGRVYADRLITEGCFRHCRNPLYLGNIMVYLGLFVIFNNPVGYLFGVPFILLVYASIVAAEEVYLRGKFGEEYNAYCRRVNRWLPRLRGLGRTIRGMSFSWARVVLADYGSTYAWLSTLLFLLGYERVVHAGFPHAHDTVTALLGLWVVATLAYAIVRYLKLSGRLRAN